MLRLDEISVPVRILEVGTGSGGIAHYFGTHASGRFEVHAVDVFDSRVVREGYEYQTVEGVELPFPEDYFDVILTNHVIEHVGGRSEQLRHLSEIRRVMANGGLGYLAVPNRWILVEPHFQLALLSWLPRSWRSSYVRLRGRGACYDCEPLQLPELEGLLASSGLRFKNMGTLALRVLLEIERPGSAGDRILRHVPDWPLDLFARLLPTLIYRLQK
ncbi:class I SAM-dependent methyltransferase [Arenimonas sp.]|uniref:class I SAM-dependent methyltransferase n=1 Tax=Arenimonas sp. TaxID=1872635 RepID=UPI002E339D4C|nr:class I SAM-dependent methyltransferase [Arenimonas sp.]HEX4853470.1 class I SAM-dependent methyltransferase [Arenimonas sp.]